MPNPQTPVAASSPIPPPVGNLAFVELRQDGRGYLTMEGWDFLQQLWAAIQGTGGLVDSSTLSLILTGVAQAATDSKLAALPPFGFDMAPLSALVEPLRGGPYGYPPVPLAIRAGTTETAGQITETVQPQAHTWSLTQTFLGELVVSPASGSYAHLRVTATGATQRANIHLSSDAASVRRIIYETGGLARWTADANATAETGANAGSDFVLARYDDAGAFIDSALTITRSTGAGVFAGAFTARGELRAEPTGGAAYAIIRAIAVGSGQRAYLYLSTDAGEYRQIVLQSAGVARWTISADNTAEGGSNAGSDLLITSYDDSGTFINNVVTINRATGVVTFTNPIVTTPTVVASLPAAGNAGARSFVTDSTVAATGNFGAVVAGGGANGVPVHDDGANWRIG